MQQTDNNKILFEANIIIHENMKNTHHFESIHSDESLNA